MKLFTIGYEGLSVGTFFNLLIDNGVENLVDVRELPLSRKPGFSKTALSELAERRGLTYTHVQALGCPSEIRHAYRADEDWSRYTVRYKKYLRKQDKIVDELASLVKDQTCCLLCFEADANFCHRLYIAERLQELKGTKLKVQHLTIKDRVRPASRVLAAA